MESLNIEKKKKLESRSNTRVHVFNIIFQLPFWPEEERKAILDKYYETIQYEEEIEMNKDENFLAYKINKNIIDRQFYNIIEKIEELDKTIASVSLGWSLERIDKVELAILRLAIYELMFEEIPKKVVINEAIILAKEYSSEKSYKFINALLAKVA